MNQPPEQLQPILTQEMCDVVAGTKLDRGWDEVRYERRTGWREAVWTGTAREPNRVGLTKSMDVITNKEKTKGEIADLYWSIIVARPCGAYIYILHTAWREIAALSSPLLNKSTTKFMVSVHCSHLRGGGCLGCPGARSQQSPRHAPRAVPCSHSVRRRHGRIM